MGLLTNGAAIIAAELARIETGKNGLGGWAADAQAPLELPPHIVSGATPYLS
jgi:hypothetical protein